MLIRRAKQGNPPSRGVSNCAAEIRHGRTVANCRLKSRHNGCRVIAQKPVRQPFVVSPTSAVRSAVGQELRQFGEGGLTHWHQIDWLPPRIRLLTATRTDHLVYDTRQDCRRMFPADDIEALKSLVGEIQCVTAISEVAISHSDQH